MPSVAPASSSDKAKVHKLQIKGSAKVRLPSNPKDLSDLTWNAQLVTEFFEYGINTILFQRGVYPPEDFSAYVTREIQ